MKYPVSLVTADVCTQSLNFINGELAHSGGLHFRINLDVDAIRQFNDTELLVLEGKLKPLDTSGDSMVSSSETFIWTLEKYIDNYYYLTLHVNSSAQVSPRLMYRSQDPYISSVVPLSLFIRHIQTQGGSTCFYVNGLKAICLYDSLMSGRSVEYLSLNSHNAANLNIISGSLLEASMYDLGHPDAVISESEIRDLYFKTIQKKGMRSDYSRCRCQSTDYPFMRRSDWKAFSDYPSVYSKYCYADESDISATIHRYTDNSHGIAEAFDGDRSTFWLTSTDLSKLTIITSFPHKIIVKALVLSITVLPEVLKIYDSSRNYVGSVQMECTRRDYSCITWSSLTRTTDTKQQQVPMLTWSLEESVTTDGLVFDIEGSQGSEGDLLAINDIFIVSTCYCAGEARCIADNTLLPIDASINYRCECPQNITGVNCDQCSDGLYTTEQDGLVDNPSSCRECLCNPLGTCQMVNSSLCLNLRTDTCDFSGRCLCRSGNSTHYDQDNHKCNAELPAIFPSYGPVSGGTRITLRGKYLAGYDRAQLTDKTSNHTIEVAITPNKVSIGGHEQLVILTPPGRKDFLQFTLKLPNLPSPDFLFKYRPNPVVYDITRRDISINGGFHVTLKGNYLDSSSRPVMLTYLFCAKSGLMHSAVITECKGNRTMMTCVTADLAVSLSTMRCIVTTRLRRAIPITVNRTDDNDYSGIYAEFGFEFDGYSRYRRQNDSEKILIYDDPVISNLTNTEISSLADSLTIEGKHLNQCCNISDYKVYIGQETCRITQLFKERIVCKLPDSWKISGADVKRDVTVELGQRPSLYVGTISVAAVDYIWDDKKLTLTIAITLTATFVTAMIVATVILSIYHKKFFKAQRGTIEEVKECRSQQCTEQESDNKSNGTMEAQVQPEPSTSDSDSQVENNEYGMSAKISLEESDDADSLEACFVADQSINSFNNKDYYVVGE
ncbi:plexin-B-like [Watersipora subatra]|uniref:plexin-B-like n=1 Tax=Watersipora subatra TaxID=2589382 RepID=UPI00355BCB7E